MPISRRSFLLGGASALVLAACSGDDDDEATPASSTTTSPAPTVPTPAPAAIPLTANPFGLGVASGDPDATSVVLWTRLLGAEGDHEVVWELYGNGNPGLVAAGIVTATPADGHSVHVIVDGLRSDYDMEYRFRAGDFESPLGRTRTMPTDGGHPLSFAFASCQNWQSGLYSVHANLAAEEKVDLVVFLGDYIYEGGVNADAIRQHDGEPPTTIEGYRARYALYKSDPSLQAAHARTPWIVTWDDHEVVNNYAGAVVDAARRDVAYQAWWEHQPTRLPRPDGSPFEIHRRVDWGTLVSFFVLDGRQYRDDQPCDRSSDLGAGCAERDDPARSMLGAAQEAWVAAEMPASTATWNVLAQQTILSPSGIPVGDTAIYNLDQWDGYPAARDRMLAVLADTANPVVITGDIHAGAVGDLEVNDAVIGTELVGPAVSSTFPVQYAAIFELAAQAAGAAMVDAMHNGYVVCEVTSESFTAHYRVVESTRTPDSPVSTLSSWTISAGTPGVQPLA